MIDRKIAPPFSSSRSLELPTVRKLKISDQFSVHYFDQVKQDLVKIDVVYKAGKWQEPFPGVSHFTSQLLEKGTTSKSSSEIAVIFDQFGAHIEIAPGFDYTTVSLYCLSNKINQVLPLFIEILSTPSFPENELALTKNIFAQNLKVNNEKNSYVSSKLIRKNIFGVAHPYGSSIEESHLDLIHQESIKAFFEKEFIPFQIYITGQLNQNSLDYALTHLKSIYRLDNVTASTPTHMLGSGKQEEYMQKPESIQTSLRLGKRIINRAHKDYPDILLLNHILGGYFGSRLMKNIREEKGLTYGIHSSLNAFLNDCFFIIGADVNKENQEITIKEIRNELKKLRGEKIDLQELEVAKSHFLGSIQLDMANPFSVIEKIKNVNLNFLNAHYYNQLFNRISKVTNEELIHTAEQYFTDDDLFIVKVG
jgi:zinc protease